MRPTTRLDPTLGLPMLTFYGTGMILGAGIYSIIGEAAGLTGESLWAGFALAAVAAFLTAFSYAELSTMFPKAGAEFVYLSRAFSSQPWFGSTVGVLMAFAGSSTAAAVAVAFAGYLRAFVDVPTTLIAALMILTFTAIAIVGVRASGWVTAISTLIEAGGLVLVIALGLQSPNFGHALAALPHEGMIGGAALIIFAFFGFENVVSLAEEARNPQRDLPRAIFLSVGIATVLYILVALAAVALLDPEQLAASEAPLLDAAKTQAPRAAVILGAVALFSTANTALISIIGASRILYGMGDAGAAPSAFHRVLPGRKTPWVTTLVSAGVALALLPLEQLSTIASLSSYATLLAFTGVNFALIHLRSRQSTLERPFRVPVTVRGVPVLPWLAALSSLFLISRLEHRAYLVGLPLTLFAAAFFWWTQKQNHDLKK